MGHVDHGKTSLLDAIRQTEVASGEAGGITQHIGAYQVHHNDKTITFLDTPGHEAFTAMRARGGQVADISVVVVAADDGVMPQTREAVDHSRAADVPILVAVNKVDKEGADPTRVRTEMTQLNLQPSEWGGETEFVDVSAKTQQGLEDLLDTILVVAELEELEANPEAEASGVVIESKLDPGRGPVVTLLVQRGTLRVGDALVAGAHWGKVRAMVAYNGERLDEAVPGDPVEVLGFDSVPDAGEFARVVDNDRTARQQANERAVRLRNEAQARRSGRKISFEDIFKGIQEGDYQELDLVLKADVSGSLEAFEDEIAKLPQDEIHVNVISSGVGGITESDVMLAAASDAVVLGFNVRPVGDARAAAEREGVEIRHYSVIYRALEDLRDAMTGMLRPEEVEETVGTVEVRQTFRASRVGTIAGCYVTDGQVTRGAKVRIVRDGTVIYDTTIALAQALQRRRARGRRRLRVRHRPGQLPGRQGGRRARGLRDAAGRAGAVLGASRAASPDVDAAPRGHRAPSPPGTPRPAPRARRRRRPAARVVRTAVSGQRRLGPAEVVAAQAGARPPGTRGPTRAGRGARPPSRSTAGRPPSTGRCPDGCRRGRSAAAPRPARPAPDRRPADLGQRAGGQAARLGQHRQRLEPQLGRVEPASASWQARSARPAARRRRPRRAARATATASPCAHPPRRAAERRGHGAPAAASAAARRASRRRLAAESRKPSVAPVRRAATGPGSEAHEDVRRDLHDLRTLDGEAARPGRRPARPERDRGSPPRAARYLRGAVPHAYVALLLIHLHFPDAEASRRSARSCPR